MRVLSIFRLKSGKRFLSSSGFTRFVCGKIGVMNGISSFVLKVSAMITMVIDHLGIRWLKNGRIFRLFGRMSFPLYAWMTAESVHYTTEKHSEQKHALRLLLLALISEVPYDLFFSNSFFNPRRNNVIFTLLAGYLVCIAFRKLDSRILKLACLGAACYLTEHFTCSYRWIGVLMIVLFDWYQSYERTHDRRFRIPFLFVVLGLYALYYITHGVTPFTIDAIVTNFRTYSYSQLGSFLALPLLAFYNGEKGYHGRAFLWFYRLFYPLHLAAALLLEKFLPL